MKKELDVPLRKKLSKVDIPRTLGPVSDLERHLRSDWWRTLFNSLYLKTDGDVVENADNTREDVDIVVRAARLKREDFICDLCCGQGRHALELARRGFHNLTGVDRSRYLIRLGRKRSQKEGLPVDFHEGDARKFRRPGLFDVILMMGNSFGYFEHQLDDERVLKNIAVNLSEQGTLLLDIVDGDWMKHNYEQRSWEWIDDAHFVCRERALSRDEKRIISREVITHAEKGILADQFYAERLYSRDEMQSLLDRLGFRSVTLHDVVASLSTRGQDLGMMARRMIFTAQTPRRAVTIKSPPKLKDVAVIMGDPTLPDPVKLGGQYNQEDLDTVERLRQALEKLPGYRFRYFNNHSKMLGSLQTASLNYVFNLCDEGYRNSPFRELHVPAYLEMLGIPYTGAGPACLAYCFNKNFVASVAASMDIPTPNETFIGVDDNGATIPATFPALLKPNFGDGSLGITQNAVVYDATELFQYLEWMRANLSPQPILAQEFLTGPEYSVGMIGNPGMTTRFLPVLEVDYSGLEKGLPKILGYESKWVPNSAYWTQVTYREAVLDEDHLRQLHDYANLLFARLGCRDYARFDFRVSAQGEIKLLEVNPNPGWCWDGKMNIMAAWAKLSYSDFLSLILAAAEERLNI